MLNDLKERDARGKIKALKQENRSLDIALGLA